jgi:hypothetical protein
MLSLNATLNHSAEGFNASTSQSLSMG